MLIGIGGQPGSGKTTLASHLQKKLRCKSICREKIFRQIFKEPNPHSVEHKILAFRECLRQTTSWLKKGQTVILDLPFSRNQEIIAAYQLSKNLKKKWSFIYLQCPEKIIQIRLKNQIKHLVPIHLRINTRTEPLSKKIPLLKIDSSPPVEKYLPKVIDYLLSR